MCIGISIASTVLRVAMFAALLQLAACASSGRSIRGQVLEESTGKPVPGAMVFVRWDGTVPTLADAPGTCVHVDTAISDAQGRYTFPPWRKRPKAGLVLGVQPVVEAYKAGYRLVSMEGTKVVRLGAETATAHDRLESLKVSYFGIRQCGADAISGRNLVPLYRAYHEEARQIARSAQEHAIADAFLDEIDLIELGYDAGMKRVDERARERERQP